MRADNMPEDAPLVPDGRDDGAARASDEPSDDSVSRVLASLPDPPPAQPSEAQERTSTATQLVQLALRRYRVGRSEDGSTFAVPLEGASIVRPLKGRDSIRSELAAAFFREHGRTVSSSALTEAGEVLEGMAMDAPRERVATRVDEFGGNSVLDLGRATGETVVVSAAGWEVRERPPLLLRRTALTCELPMPQGGYGIDVFRSLVHTDEQSFRLLVAWLVAVLFPSIPRPILLLIGQQGCAKSTTARFLGRLIDPSPAQLCAPPRDADQWALSAAGSAVVVIDNLSTVQPWLSDALCRAVTGDALVRRHLYSDTDLVVTAFRRAVILTTIDAGAFRGDLAERTLAIELRPIEPDKRRRETQLDAEFASIHARALGALLDLAADVVRVRPTVNEPEWPRMADFGLILASLDHLLGWDTLQTYTDLADRVTRDVLEGDPFALAVLRLVRDVGEWEGTATDLRGKLPRPKHEPGWPRTPQAVSGQLRRLAPALRAAGVEMAQRREPGGSRTRTIILRLAEADSSGSEASRTSRASRLSRDDRDAGDDGSPPPSGVGQ